MSFIKRCDRCKKDFGEGIQSDNELHFTKERKTAFGYDKLIHLCNDCLKKFDKFMEEKE